MSVNPLAYGQQFILQAPQPQPRPFTAPFPMAPMMPPVMPSPLADIFSRQDELPAALSKPGAAPDSEADVKKFQMTDDVNQPIKDGEQPSQGEVSGLSGDGTTVTEDVTVDIAGPIILNLKSTTKDDLTIMAGQDLAELFKAAGPELLDAMKKVKNHEKDKAEKGKSEKSDSDKLTVQEPPAEVAPIEPTPMPVVPKMSGFNTLG